MRSSPSSRSRGGGARRSRARAISTPSGAPPTASCETIAHRPTHPLGVRRRGRSRGLRGFRISSGIPGRGAPWHRRDRRAPVSIVASRRLHRRRPADEARRGGAVMQPARHSRAARHGGRARPSPDAAAMRAAPRRRGSAAATRAGLQPCDLMALHRAARADGRSVARRPPARADRDRRAHEASRGRHRGPAGRGRRPYAAPHVPPSAASERGRPEHGRDRPQSDRKRLETRPPGVPKR